MKRTIPLLITAVAGFVIIVSQFIPRTISWGEDVAVWFDILAAIAFVLGGGSLMKMHLKKISDRKAGWGYSGITLVAFLVTLIAGIGKIGSGPAPDQEFFGETFVEFPLSALPDAAVTRIEGSIPSRADGEPVHASVQRQLSEEEGQIVFRGWMLAHEKLDLLKHQDELAWQCKVEQLYEQAQPPAALAGKITYYANHGALSFRGFMTDEDRRALLELGGAPQWRTAVEQLATGSRRETRVRVESPPDSFEIPDSLADVVFYAEGTGELGIKGPMSTTARDALARQPFRMSRPLAGERRNEFRERLEGLGSPLSDAQSEAFDSFLNSSWNAEELRTILNDAADLPNTKKSACRMLAEKNAGEADIQSEVEIVSDLPLNDEQFQLLERFAADDSIAADELFEDLKAAQPMDPAEPNLVRESQRAALQKFVANQQTVGVRNKRLAIELLKRGALSTGQRDFLLADYRAEYAWRTAVDRLFRAAHVVKYAWSGSYRTQGSIFLWLFEYAFKPLTATMFAMLAFYVASAAFRAFRAKNFEAILLLGAAFIILLGRTFAGVLLTDWLPEQLSGLRAENLTVYIMKVLNTAGIRAIMIGIALGIASTSLKVLLGVDRSYLGSQDE